MKIPSDTSLGQKQDLDGWDMTIFQGLNAENKKAYELAAKLHHGIFRKDDQPYLMHINRSLQFLEKYKTTLPKGIDIQKIQGYIILHDCIEDNPKGLEEIYTHFGDAMTNSVLWMSKPKGKVLNQINHFLEKNKSAGVHEKYSFFVEIKNIIDTESPESISTIEILQKLLPKGKWITLWEDLFQEKYHGETDIEKQKNIFADWIFQGMVLNMPEDFFYAKSLERLDNLTDIDGLQGESGVRSYKGTMQTTDRIYLQRLSEMGLKNLSKVLADALYIGYFQIMGGLHRVSEKVRDITGEE